MTPTPFGIIMTGWALALTAVILLHLRRPSGPAPGSGSRASAGPPAVTRDGVEVRQLWPPWLGRFLVLDHRLDHHPGVGVYATNVRVTAQHRKI